MAVEIKAVVFKTCNLKATKEFFASTLRITIKESSTTHFVIHSKGIRLLFVESDKDFEVELYTSSKAEELIAKNSEIRKCEDPNGIKIIISDYHSTASYTKK
jgi:hypothetical protein